MRRVLFVCSQNKLRSPTAEQVFATYPGIEADSAGIAHDAITPLSSEQVEWADIIMVMEAHHRSKLSKRFKTHLKGKRVIVLGIPDDYEYMQPELVRLLEMKATPFLR
ncbi:MAG: low molecular weight protein tyrosine phosphatase family protein [Amphiplicatus sp.]